MTNKFKMNRGYCHLFQDKLVFNAHRELRPEDITRKSFSNYGFRLIIGIFLSICFYFIYQDIVKGEFPSILLGLLSLFIFLLFIISFKMTSKVWVKIDTIEYLTLNPGSERRQTYINIFYKDNKQKVKQQMVIFPSKKNGGGEALNDAFDLFSQLGYELRQVQKLK